MTNICSERFLDPFASPFVLSTVCHVITFFEFPLHISGGYCILVKTPKKMEKVKMSMMIMHISIVFMNFIESFLVIPFAMVPVMAGTALGWLNKIRVPLELQLCSVITGPAVAGISILAVYENRYSVLCDNFIWKRIRVPYLIFNYLSAFSCFIYPAIQIPEQTSARNVVLEKYPCIFQKSQIDINSIIVLGFNPIAVAGPLLAQIVFNYAQGLVFLFLTYNYFSTKALKLSPSTYQMQKKFMIALLMQSLIFTIFLGGPVSAITLTMFADSYDQGFNNLSIIALSMNASISTIAMIYFHPSYRQWTAEAFRKLFKKPNTIVAPSVVSVI